MYRLALTLFSLLLLGVNGYAIAKMPKSSDEQIALFTKPYEFSEVKLSPEGSYISVIKNTDNIRSLIILDAKTFKPTYQAKFAGDEEVGNYAWVNDSRLAIEKLYNRGWAEEPEYYGEIFAVNADGSKPMYLFGQLSAVQQTGSHLNKNTAIRAIGYIRHALPEDKKFMIVKAYSIGNGRKGFMSKTLPQLYKVNVYNGKRRKIITAPVYNADFTLNHKHQPIFATGTNSDNQIEIFQRIDGKWKNADNLQGKLDNFRIIGFAENNSHIYAKGTESGSTQAVYKINIDTAKQQKLIQNENVDPLKFWKDDNTDELYAVEFGDGYPVYNFVNKNSGKTKKLKALLKSLPGHQLHLVSETLDGNKTVIAATNDRNPGTYYLYDAGKNKLQTIASEQSWIDPNDLADVKPIKFTSRDGLTIHGYITMPYGVEHKNLPLVVNPHGGPIARDFWAYNAQAQLLAQNGIATLQINFRGSDGYGKKFEEAGYLQWGKAIQYDIIDGVNYTIDQGWINKDKICIEGGSFGAYSAIQSSIVAPDLFKCAIGVAGVYDLPLMKEEGDIPSLNFGDSYLSEVIGDDLTLQQAMSPSYNVDKLKAKILLVHGERDRRTPIEQYESLAEALEKANYPFEKMIFEKEGHGFYNPENQAKYYKKMLSFIKENLNL